MQICSKCSRNRQVRLYISLARVKRLRLYHRLTVYESRTGTEYNNPVFGINFIPEWASSRGAPVAPRELRPEALQ